MTGSAFPGPSEAERAWFCQQQAYADAIAYRRTRLAAPCPDCGPRRCDDHATDIDLISSYQHAAALASAPTQGRHPARLHASGRT
jgi:hypothetical protein